jgi:acetyl esterase
MPLDPDVAALVAELNRSARPAAETTVAELRASSWGWVPYMGPPETVARVEDRFIPGPTADLPVRIYSPTTADPTQGIVFFHGSGWTTANIDVADSAHRALSNATGSKVIAVNYQKAPEHKFPIPVQDAVAATTWAIEHAEELGLDPRRIGVGGDSAGGNIAAAVCLAFSAAGTHQVSFALLIYPVTDSRMQTQSMADNANGYLLTAEDVGWYWDQYLATPEDGENELASPLRAADLSGFPPTVVVTAGYDPLRDEGRDLAHRLTDAGVRVRHRDYPGAVHGFFWMAGALDVGRQLFRDLGDDVRDLNGS